MVASNPYIINFVGYKITALQDGMIVEKNVSVQYPVISRRFIAEKSVLSTQKGTDFSLRSK